MPAGIPFTPIQEIIDQGTYQLRLSLTVDGKTMNTSPETRPQT